MEIRKVAQYIEQERLFDKRDKILVALSGGADSVALLRLLLSLEYTCEAAHCNFHLRGTESDRDEAFVRHLCKELQVNLHVIHFDTKKIAEERHISIEMAARELRYNWFEKLRKECHAAVIAVAHHQDDSVETFLLNLIRGTGINGLKGILSPKWAYCPTFALHRPQRNHGLSGTPPTRLCNRQHEFTRRIHPK